MAFDGSWRPPNWNQIKQNVINESPAVFSPSMGYTKEQKDTIIEKTATAVLSALAETIVTDSKE